MIKKGNARTFFLSCGLNNNNNFLSVFYSKQKRNFSEFVIVLWRIPNNCNVWNILSVAQLSIILHQNDSSALSPPILFCVLCLILKARSFIPQKVMHIHRKKQKKKKPYQIWFRVLCTHQVTFTWVRKIKEFYLALNKMKWKRAKRLRKETKWM